MRIFSPGYEMPFAGHPTLGTAFVLATDGLIGPQATQEVPAGEFAVEVDLDAGTASVLQLAPGIRPRVRRASASASPPRSA